MTTYQDFHIVTRKDESERVASLLRSAGIRIQEHCITEIGCHEYIIAVHLEDMERASEIFWHDVGPGGTFTSHDPADT